MAKAIRIKYCGGCNPRYDRKAVTEKLRAAFPETEFVEIGDDGREFDHVIVLCGCPAACASHEELCGTHGKTVVDSAEESAKLEDCLRIVPL